MTTPEPCVRSVVLPDSPATAGLARDVVAGLLAVCGVPRGDLVDTAVLLTSEVVTNALLHACPGEWGSRSLALTARVEADSLRVEVSDPDPAMRLASDATPGEECGRGLALVASLAKEWGISPHPTGAGKSVWFASPLS